MEELGGDSGESACEDNDWEVLVDVKEGTLEEWLRLDGCSVVPVFERTLDKKPLLCRASYVVTRQLETVLPGEVKDLDD